MRRIRLLSILLILVLVFGNIVYAQDNGSNKSEPITLSVLCNTTDVNHISGLYKDNSFFVTLKDLCEIIGGEISSNSLEYPIIKISNGMRKISINTKTSKLEEDFYAGYISADLPTMIVDNNVYVSLFHFLRYMGVEYTLNENTPIQVSIYKRYDIYDALGEYFKFDNGNLFNWTEIAVESETSDWYETEQERVEAELIDDGVIALMNRDPNIFRWIFNPEGIEKEAIEDALLSIIKTECPAVLVEETNANQVLQMGKSIVGTGTDWYTIFAENYKKAHSDIPKIGEQIDDLGGLFNNTTILGINVFVAFDALREYDNLSDVQKNLLENTIIKYFEEPRILKKEWETSYGVASELNKKIQDTYMANYKAADKAGTTIAFDYINAAAGVSNPVSAYIECMDLLANIIPKYKSNISKKERIYNAYNCYMYQNLANYIFCRWYNDFYYHNDYNYDLKKNKSCSIDIKNALIFQVKSSIATRSSLLQSNSLTDDLFDDMTTINKKMEQFLNKLEGCKTEGLINTNTNYDDNLSWILNYTDNGKIVSSEGSDSGTDEHLTNPFLSIIDDLATRYGSLRIVQGNGEWQNEANGLCYLNLIDFTGDGNDELFAVCKNDDEDHYTGYIYTLNNGKAELIYENPEIEYNTRYEYDIVYLGYTKDTGFIFGTGWDAPDIDDRTFYWYKDGDFEPVYRSKGYYDDGLEEKVIEEELKIVDIFDDEHIDELWDSFPRVTLRTMGEDDENGNYFGLSELQKSIDDVIRRLDVTPAELPPEVILPGMDVIADAEIYFCLENEIDQWEPSIENDEYFWSVIGNYGLSEPRIDDLNPIVTGDIGDAFILDKSIIENAAYACFSDFSGSLPQFRSYPDMWLVREVGEQTVTLGYGELGVMTERKNYEVNKDKSLDVIYTASYFQDEIEPIADYSVHMVENPNYDKENEFFTYYYTVTNIEKIKDYTETPATADEEAENDGVDPAITDISQVIDMNLTAAEAAHELGLNYEVEDDSEYYFYADSSCDESQGMLWCYGYQYDQNNNWKYHPGDSGISVYGLKNEMSEEELSSIVNKTHFIDVADYFGGDENDKFYYDTNQNEFVIAGKVQNGAVTDLTVFNAIDY